MSHAIERTSPTGSSFRGTCIKCKAENLGMADALLDCPMDNAISDEVALVLLIKKDATGKGDSNG